MVENRLDLHLALESELPRLRRFAWSLTAHREDADDLTQRVVERLLIKGVPADVDLRRWAYRVCKNIWVDEIRYRDVRRRLAPEVAREEMIDGEAEMVGLLDAEKVVKAVAELSDPQRLCLSLVTVEGMSYADAANEMGVATGTVMSRLNRARENLKSLLNMGEATVSDKSQGQMP